MSPARLPDDDEMLRTPRYRDGKRAPTGRRQASSGSGRERSTEDRSTHPPDPRQGPGNPPNEEDR